MADRSDYKAGDRLSWFMRPKRGQCHRTGTIIGVNWSQRLGLSWLVEVDQEGGKRAIVNPQHEPLLMKQWKDVTEGEAVRLPPDLSAPDPEVLEGVMIDPVYCPAGAGGQWFAMLRIVVNGKPDITEVPVTPDGEVATFSKRDSEAQH